MKLIRIGLTTSNLSSLLHENIYLTSKDGLFVSGFLLSKEQICHNNLDKPYFSQFLPDKCLVEIKNGALTIDNCPQNNIVVSLPKQNEADSLWSVLLVSPKSGYLAMSTYSNPGSVKSYAGQLLIIAEQNKIRLVLYYSLENYVQSVLCGEIPAKYHIEAIKAQAVCARSYGLHPRVDHSNDFCDVCDSYQCCQCFVGMQEKKNPAYAIASDETNGQILAYDNKPALALFSSCAGGHTENYEDCFSNSITKLFPPEPIPYLKGISENLTGHYVKQRIDEKYLKRLWQTGEPETVDAWAKNFRWSVKLSNQDLESHIHNNVVWLLENKDFAPFIVSPPSDNFGEILSFKITKRGVGGTAIILKIETSKGSWQFTKELTIRNLFKNPNINLKRLSSARVYFDQIRNNKEYLTFLHIYGLGSGHGVGLQQIGAEGLARNGKNYRQILDHYYTKTTIITL